MRNIYTNIIFSFLLILTLNASLSAQQRPKVGLVLSGGGAKGMAHIGILKILEEAGIRPDYITGTSMGGIVGGLYATGYSAVELEKIVKNINWDEVLTNKVRLNEIAIEEKPYYGRYVVELPVHDYFEVGLPRGLIEGQKLGTLLFDLTRSVHDIDDFSKLPIPFACVATDIATGQPVLLNKGSLARSLRASMAIPTIFTPVEIDGKLLVDGGLVRNFPVQEVIDMGADIVIGIFVSSDLKSKDGLKDFVSILFQSSWVLSAYDTREQKKNVDYYIEPELGEYETGSFKSSEKIIELGEESGKKFYDSFKRLADSLNQFGAQQPVVRPQSVQEYTIQSIIIEGNNDISDDIIKGKLRIEDHSVIDAREIEKRVELLFGIGAFDNIGYELRTVDGGHDLIVTVRESASGKVKFAMHYDSENGVGINANYTLRNVLSKNSRAIAEIDLAEFPRINLNYLKYLGKKQNVAGMLNFDYNSFNPALRRDEGKEVYSISQYNITGTLFSTAVSNRTFGASFSRNYINLKPVTAESNANFISIKNKGYTIRAFYLSNTLDRPYYPRYGSKSFLSATYLLGFDGKYKYYEDSTVTVTETELSLNNTFRGEGGHMKIFSLGKSLSLISDSRLSLTDMDEANDLLNAINFTFAGGFHPRVSNSIPFYGTLNYDYSLASYFMTKLDLQYEMFPNVLVTGGVNLVSINYPMEWLGIDDKEISDLGNNVDYRLGYGLSLGYYSLIGPISVALTWDSQWKDFIGNVNIGFYF